MNNWKIAWLFMVCCVTLSLTWLCWKVVSLSTRFIKRDWGFFPPIGYEFFVLERLDCLPQEWVVQAKPLLLCLFSCFLYHLMAFFFGVWGGVLSPVTLDAVTWCRLPSYKIAWGSQQMELILALEKRTWPFLDVQLLKSWDRCTSFL